MATTKESTPVVYCKPKTWVSIWFVISSILVFWDSFYVLLRPRSMPNGDLHSIFAPYELYGRIDYQYGWKAFDSHDGFVTAQSTMNLFENALNMVYLFLVCSGKGSVPSTGSNPTAYLVGFAAVVMTFSKTVLYFFVDYYCGENGFCQTGHNIWWPDYVVLWMIPNLSWVFVPGTIIIVYGRELLQCLHQNTSVEKKQQ